ncbi:MAG TPA: extracellular solute-binding protein [Ktedonobacteraceae bacterium]
MKDVRTMLKHVFLLVGITALAAGLLAACGGPSTPTVTVWSWRSQDAPLWQHVQDALNKQGVKVRIQFRAVNATSYDSVLQTAMDGGKGPDIMYTRAGSGTESYAAANMLEPLNGLVDFSKISSASLASSQYAGKTYAVPFAIQTMVVYYNKDMFAKYGLAIPKTWNDFIHVCDVLKSKGVTPIATMGIQGWLLALNFDEVGASLMDNQFIQDLVNRKASYTSAEYVNALTHYQQLSQYFEPNFAAVGSAGSEQETTFALGKSAMIMDGIWEWPTIQQYNKNLQMGEFLVPPAQANQSPKIDWYVDGGLALNAKIADSAEKAAAQAAIKYTATPQFGQDFSAIAGEISPIAGVQIPSQYTLSIQAYKWYQSVPVNPIFDIRSPMDTPPVVPINKQKANAVNTDQGIFTLETNDMLQLLTHKMTPQQTAAAIQKGVAWYFKT